MAIVGERVPLETNELAGMAALLERWQREQVKAVVARVVDIDRPWSERRPAGAALAVNERGEVGGSLGRRGTEAVVSAALDVLQAGRPRLVTFAHGETVHVFLEPVDWSGRQAV